MLHFQTCAVNSKHTQLQAWLHVVYVYATHTHTHVMNRLIDIVPPSSVVCWQRNHKERPSFQQIMVALRQMENSQFFMSTSHEEFRSMQTNWREEILSKFLEQKKLEKVSSFM